MRFEPLDGDRVARALTTRWLGRTCECLATCASTNDVAAARGRAGAPEGLVVITDEQTGGRGRLGRSWHATPRANLTFSVLLRPERPPVEVPPLTLLAGAAVAAAIAPFGVQPRLKWPNDVLLEGRKVAGILCELGGGGPDRTHLVVGVGINVHQAREDFPPALRDTATSLWMATGRRIPRGLLLCRLFARLEAWEVSLVRDGPMPVAGAAAARMPWLGRRVRIVSGTDRWEGTAVRLEPDGALLMALPEGGTRRLVAGDVTLAGDPAANTGGACGEGETGHGGRDGQA